MIGHHFAVLHSAMGNVSPARITILTRMFNPVLTFQYQTYRPVRIIKISFRNHRRNGTAINICTTGMYREYRMSVEFFKQCKAVGKDRHDSIHNRTLHKYVPVLISSLMDGTLSISGASSKSSFTSLNVNILTTFLPFGLRVVKPSLLQHKSALDSPVFLNESKSSFLSLCFPFTYPKGSRWKRR